jgi:LPS export ABC transporter protein LptC
MSVRAMHIIKFLPAAMLTGMLFITACENDLKKIQELSANVNTSIQSTKGVDVIYSDSTRVKAHMISPLMVEYKDIKKPYVSMPKGVKIIFYDENLEVSSTVVADSAVRRETDGVIELHKNVIAVNDKKETFTSDELIWDEKSKKVYSNKLVQIKLATGTVLNGTSFISNQKLSPWTMNQSTGQIHVNENFSQ